MEDRYPVPSLSQRTADCSVRVYVTRNWRKQESDVCHALECPGVGAEGSLERLSASPLLDEASGYATPCFIGADCCSARDYGTGSDRCSVTDGDTGK